MVVSQLVKIIIFCLISLTNKGPKKSLVILGYSGWGSGQLEGEMERDHWILSDLDPNIIFEKDSKKKWEEAYKNSFIKI